VTVVKKRFPEFVMEMRETEKRFVVEGVVSFTVRVESLTVPVKVRLIRGEALLVVSVVLCCSVTLVMFNCPVEREKRAALTQLQTTVDADAELFEIHLVWITREYEWRSDVIPSWSIEEVEHQHMQFHDMLMQWDRFNRRRILSEHHWNTWFIDSFFFELLRECCICWNPNVFILSDNSFNYLSHIIHNESLSHKYWE
jgi:hypothetical protein